jgi:hypothetical protein
MTTRRLFLVLVVVLAPCVGVAQERLKPPAAGPVKIQNAEATLFESVETAQECVALVVAWDDYDRQRKARQDAIKAAEVKCAGKPYAEVKLSELAAWKEARAKCAGEIADAEGVRGAARPRALAREVCGPATTAVLSKGTELQVLGKKATMSKVKVETGRSTGLVGWVLDSDITPPKP